MATKKVTVTLPKIPGYHLVIDTCTTKVYFPDHEDRNESSKFRASRKLLITLQDTPCWICDTKENRELHHFHVQWALSDIVDWEAMKKFHPDFNWSKFKKPQDFIDHPYNLLVLCKKHHTSEDNGIHSLPYPIWVMQKYKIHDVVLTEDDLLVEKA